MGKASNCVTTLMIYMLAGEKFVVRRFAQPVVPVVPSEDKVTFRGHSEVVKKPTPTTTTTTTSSSSPAQDANSQITKPHGESGESDPGYESDSSKSKPHEVLTAEQTKVGGKIQKQQQQNSEQQQHQKACTLPRRSAKVSVQPSSSTLDRRKLKSLADSEAGVTVEIISPIRVCY